MLTTRNTRENVHDVPRLQRDGREFLPHEVLVHEHVHVGTPASRFVDDPIADPGKGGLECPENSREVRHIEDDLVLPARIGAESRRNPHEHARIRWVRGCAGRSIPPRLGIPGETKSLWSGDANRRAPTTKGLSRI